MEKMMKALVYDSPGRVNSSVRRVPYPECGDDEIIIKVMSASICKGVEHAQDNGTGTNPSRYPIIPGHEFSGCVQEVGKNVTAFKPGDRVTADNTGYCGDCYYCREDKPGFCINFDSLGQSVNGGFAEYVRIKKDKAYHIPDHVSFNAAALSEPVACCLHAVERSRVKYGDTVVIFGAGSMGLILAQLFQASNARKVYIVAGNQNKLKIAAKRGVKTITMDRDNYSVHEKAILQENPMGVDIIVDAAGSPEICSKSMKLLKKGGLMLQYAYVHSRENLTFDPVLMFENEITFTTSFGQSHGFGKAVQVLADGIVNGDSLVTGEYTLDDFYMGLDENVNDKDSIKVIIHPNLQIL